MAAVAPARAESVPDGGFALIDRPTGLGAFPFDGVSEAQVVPHSLSADGRYVVFSSRNDILMSGDVDSAQNVYRLDRTTGVVELVSATAAGVPSVAGSSNHSATVSANGRYVAFSSQFSNLHPAAAGATVAILVKDMVVGDVRLASRATGAAGTPAARAFEGVISGDGRSVVFANSGSFDGENADGSNALDVYVRNLDTEKTWLATVPGAGGDNNGDLRDTPDINGDGTALAIVTTSGLISADTDDTADAYVIRTVQSSPTPARLSGILAVKDAAISADGTRLAWTTNAVTTATCTPTCTGFEADGPDDAQDIADVSFPPSLGGTTRVIWTTDRARKPADTNASQDVYSRVLGDASEGGLALLTDGVTPGDKRGATATDDGALTVFSSLALAFPGTDADADQVFSTSGGETVNISQPLGAPARRNEWSFGSLGRLHAVSADGGVVVFVSQASALGIPTDPVQGRFNHVFVRDVAAEKTELVTVAAGGGFASRGGGQQHLDAAGDRVLFVSRSPDLPEGVGDNQIHVFLRDRTAGTTRLVDRATPGGAPFTTGVAAAVLSGDGKKAALVSDSPELPGANLKRHVYLVDLATGALTLVDHAPDGSPSDAGASDPDLDFDGDRVAFFSGATNLVAGRRRRTTTRAMITEPNIWVADLATGKFLRAASAEDGDPEHTDPRDPAVSADGTHVAFVNRHAQFGFGADGNSNVFVRDLGAGTTTRASVGVGVVPGSDQFEPTIAADGNRVAFVEFSGDRDSRTYVRDVAAGTTTQLAPHTSFDPSLAANGRCAVFTSDDPGLISPGVSPDFTHVYLRALGAACPPAPAQGPGPADTTPQGGADTTKPVVGQVSMTHKRFAVGKAVTALVAGARRKRPARGTAFRFTLSEAATTRVAIAKRLPGRRVGKRCVKPTRKLRKKKRCVRFVRQLTLVRTGTIPGANRVAFSGRVPNRRLRPGRYRATLVATDAAGNRSAATRVAFGVVKG